MVSSPCEVRLAPEGVVQSMPAIVTDCSKAMKASSRTGAVDMHTSSEGPGVRDAEAPPSVSDQFAAVDQSLLPDAPVQ